MPKASRDETERIYQELAEWCQRPIPNVDQRIYEIEWEHDGEEWTAIVGEKLRGQRVRVRRRRGRDVETRTPLSDSATVLAIFAGEPYFVVTDARPLGSVVSAWVNPLMAGRPRDVRYFANAP